MIDQDIPFSQGEQVAEMTATDGAEPGNQDTS